MTDKRNLVDLQHLNKRMKLWLVIVIELMVIILLIIGVVSQRRALLEKNEEALVLENISEQIDLSVMAKEIQAIGELATMEYLYTDAGRFMDNMQIQGIDIPLTTKSFLIKWDGVIKAGIDVTQITMSTDEGSKKITVYIPQARILSHEIDNDSLETLDERNNIFNKITVDNVNTFMTESKKNMEGRALENGLLEKALENAKVLIVKFLESNEVIKGNYEIEIVVLEE